MSRELLRVENLSCSYGEGAQRYQVLKNVNLSVQEGDFIAIEGPSGSGKSTLFYVLGCLLRPESGRIFFDGQELTKLSMDEMAYVRNRKIGFIFQQFHLLPRASVLSNILLPTLYPCEVPDPQDGGAQKARELAGTLGIGDKLGRPPNELSGGQQQRVAIARALMKDVRLILADEPTGNLDSKSAAQILELLRELNRAGKTIILITHDPNIARQCGKIWRLRDGVFTEIPVENSQLPPPPPPKTKREERALLGFKSGIVPFVRHYARLARSVAPLAFENLYRNKMRAFLTMVGVTVGIAAVLSMITFGEFVKARILQSYEELGVNTLSVYGWRNRREKATDKVSIVFDSFNWEKDVLPLLHIFPEIVRISPSLGAWSNTLTYGGQSIDQDVHIFGVNPQYLTITNREVEHGRVFTPYNVANADSVCLVGPEIVQKLFLDMNPIGKIMFVTGGNDRPAYPCQVIGILKSETTNKDWRKPNLEVLMPFTYFERVNDYWDTQIHSFNLQVEPGSDIERTSRGIKNFFRQKYGASAEFGVGSDAILLAQMKKFLNLFTLMLASIALITLGVGGMGINNMMLVAISERLKEIGLRKALGATDRSIRVQFLLESTFLCLISGLTGVLLGFSSYELIIYATSKFVNKISFEWVFDPLALTISLVSIVIVGIASGIIPALKAERLQVIEALRNE